MKAGDLININAKHYPKLKGKTGLLVEVSRRYLGEWPVSWSVMIGESLYPYPISEEDMKILVA